jgi:hypothetical protein
MSEQPRETTSFSFQCVLFLARENQEVSKEEKKEIKSPNSQAPEALTRRGPIQDVCLRDLKRRGDGCIESMESGCLQSKGSTGLYLLLSVLAKVTVHPSCIEWSHVSGHQAGTRNTCRAELAEYFYFFVVAFCFSIASSPVLSLPDEGLTFLRHAMQAPGSSCLPLMILYAFPATPRPASGPQTSHTLLESSVSL